MAAPGQVVSKMELCMDFEALTDFHLVAAHGGFGAASRASGIPKPTLSRRVRALEAQLGIRLFERGGHSLQLTEEGRGLKQRTDRLLDELAEIEDEIAGQAGRPRGRLRVNVPVLFAHTSLGDIAARFVADYPEVLLDITVDDRFVDPVSEGYDVIVRVNPQPQSGLVGHCILRDTVVIAASPAVVMPSSATQAVPVVVLSAAPSVNPWRIDGPDGERLLTPHVVMRCSSMLLVRNAVLAGTGAAVMPRWLVAPEVEAGRLVIWGDVPDRTVEVWALHPSRRLQSPKVKAFIDALIRAFPERQITA
jgi:DNA-binding transcriptional LysR family regulator